MQARGVLSCDSCRQRKLKCDRSQPCSNCISRNVTCKYASSAVVPRGAARRDETQHLAARVRHLEHLVNSMAAKVAQEEISASTDRINHGAQAASLPDAEDDGASIPMDSETLSTDSLDTKRGRIMSSNEQVVYVSTAHWAEICSEVTYLSSELGQNDLQHTLENPESPHCQGNLLLESKRDVTSIQEILSDLPDRKVADRLVSRYFGSAEPSIVLLHIPTFEREYKCLWSSPETASVPWISLLFGVMSLGAYLYMREGEDLPESLGQHRPQEIMEVMHQRSTDCLILSKYASMPTTYTIEALLLNIQNEFLRHKDTQVGISVLAGVAIRLAMRMGYHRDPKIYPELLPSQCETRRRVWANILHLDVIISFQLGLPCIVQESQFDTELPRNLLDEDFDSNSLELPKPRSETEFTPVLYTIIKTRILSVFRLILAQVSLGRRTDTYEKVVALDERLRRVYEYMPACLKLTSPESTITASTSLLIRRYNLELMYQRARCILHRHHMTDSMRDVSFSHSRISCVDSAMALLTHQIAIHQETRPGGILYRDKWFVSSLEQHDFLLASMIICLELSFRARGNAGPSAQARTSSDYSEAQLLQTLVTAHRNWSGKEGSSLEAREAFRTLSLVLERSTGSSRRPTFSSQTQRGEAVVDEGTMNTVNNDSHPWYDEIGDFLTSPELDWGALDSIMQDPETMDHSGKH